MSPFIKSLLLSGIEPLINQALMFDPQAEALLEPLVGRTLAINLTDIKLECSIVFSKDSLTLVSQFEPLADTTLQAPLMSLIRYARDPNQSLKPLNIRISGDIQSLKPLLNLLQQIEPDWEEAIAQRIGDSAAAQLSYWTKHLLRWSKRSKDQLTEQTKSFLQKGDHSLTTKSQHNLLYDAVDNLSIDTERLELKIAHLESKYFDSLTEEPSL